jgi:hypothetical protein
MKSAFEPTEFTVTLYFRAPAWDERNGIPFIVSGRSKTEAIAAARHEAERHGHIPCRGKGRYWFEARQSCLANHN